MKLLSTKTYIPLTLVFLITIFITQPAYAAQTGGGYVVQDQANAISGTVSGNGVSSQLGGSPISQTVIGNGISSYGGAYRAPATPPPVVVIPPSGGGSSSGGGGGGGGGGGAVNNTNSGSTSTIPTVTAVAPVANQIACTQVITVAKPIRFGSKFKNNPEDVKIVQRFLNTYEGTNLKIDGKYKKVDFDAVVRWQEKYSDIILKPWALKKGTGYVYTTSAAQMKRQQKESCTQRATVPPPAYIDVLEVKCPYFTTYHNSGSKGPEVEKIQEFLNREVGAGLAVDGVYDFETKFAVKLFQKKYSKDILSFWSFKIPSGWWYKTTAKKANQLVGCPVK